VPTRGATVGTGAPAPFAHPTKLNPPYKNLRLQQRPQFDRGADPLERRDCFDELPGALGADHRAHQVARLVLDLGGFHRIVGRAAHRGGAMAHRLPLGGLDRDDRLAGRHGDGELRARHHGDAPPDREHGRIGPEHLDDLCADWREREAFLSGPGDMLDAMSEHWDKAGECDRLHMERFQPIIGQGDGELGEGGTINFLESGIEARSKGAEPILVAGEEAGATLPYGCRMGICHTCVGKLCSGKIRDLRTGEVSGSEGEIVRTCVNAPEGPIEIAL